MSLADIVIEPFDARSASESAYTVFTRFWNIIRREIRPDDPPWTLEECIQNGRSIPSFLIVSRWLARHPSANTAVGGAEVMYRDTPDNRHLVEFNIGVLPEHRRQGIARQLLASVVQVPVREQRGLMLTVTNEHAPGGAAFMERLGGRKGMAEHVNQLKVEDLDRDLLRVWQARAVARAADFELGFWDGPYPEEHLVEIGQLFDVMNDAPHDDLAIEDFKKTPEHLREMDKSLRARGSERWTMYAREKATGKLAGFTEVVWKPFRPYLLEQHGTGVFPVYRNRGLGRWLKAAMLVRVLRERPQVTLIRTGNADSNTAMLNINRALGFKPYLSETMWQVETDKVLAYLGQGPDVK